MQKLLSATCNGNQSEKVIITQSELATTEGQQLMNSKSHVGQNIERKSQIGNSIETWEIFRETALRTPNISLVVLRIEPSPISLSLAQMCFAKTGKSNFFLQIVVFVYLVSSRRGDG